MADKATAAMGQRAAVDEKTRRRNRFRKEYLNNWQLYVLLLLPLIWLIIFCYYPMLGTQIAFKKFKLSQGIWGSPWVGLDNFQRFFHSYQFTRVLKNTLTLSFYNLLAGFPLPIILALALNVVRNQFYKKFVQMVTYIPHFISVLVIVGMLIQIFNPRIGLYGVIVQRLTGEAAPDLLGNPKAFPHLYVWSGAWQTLGWSSIIYLSALSAVDPELHEAAKVDGASRFKRLLVLDLPTVIPTATILLILNVGRIMSIGFEKVYLMQNDLNLSASEIISTYVYKVALGPQGGDFSLGAAIGLFNSVINLILIVVVNKVSNKVSGSGLW
ncbi:ABC transporter permease subunit [Ruminococcaceae bacterium OttesenSCG-928-L11]|nr:ABC transporter permease subunit [Ruminococcaceae bacterium OttesenSCG-928-L11]